jgi:hypothetical protein
MKGKQEKERKEFRTWLFIETFECSNKKMKSELRALQAEGTQKSKNYPYITFLPHFIEFMQLSLRLLLFAILLIYSTHSFLFYISNFHIHQNISILHESLISFIDRSGFST